MILDNASATGATALSLGILNTARAVPADNTVQLSRSAEQDVTLTFSGIQTGTNIQDNGRVVNFVVGGTSGTVNGDAAHGGNARIVLSNVIANSTLVGD